MKKTLIFILAMALCVSMFSISVFADPAEETVVAETTAVADTEDADVAEVTDDTAAEEAVQDTEAAETTETTEGETDTEGISEGTEYLTVEVNFSDEGEVIVEDYSEIEIPKVDVEVTEEERQAVIDNVINSGITYEDVTEGTVEEGDEVVFDFSGVLEGEEEPFEGGTAEDYDLVIGSGMFIEGFEEQLIGHELGTTFDINVTFPEDYAEELAGKNAVFTINLKKKVVTVTPELTDEYVQQFSAENLDEQLNTVSDLDEYVNTLLYNDKLNNAIMNVMYGKTTVISYPQEEFELVKSYSAESLSYYASMYAMYGMEADEEMVAQMSGYATVEDYTNDEAKYYMDTIMMLDTVASDKGIEVTEEDVNAEVTNYLIYNGLETQYDVESFKEVSGEAWVYLITKLNAEYNKVVEVLKENVVFTE